MSKNISAIRGMNDILPSQTPLWQHAEEKIRAVLSSYGYQEIRFPIVEKTELFKRSIGEATDIVEKEMYTFPDRHGDSLTLRPEGTACCVRAGIEQGLLYHQIQRLWYLGPMFRYERPQKGRYRQFYHLGVETFGMQSPNIDAELILMSARFWRELGIQDKLVLQLNSLGTIEERALYREQLVAYFTAHIDSLDADSQRRLTTNPLRILDSKNPDMIALNKNAPTLLETLGDASRQHFETLCQLLEKAGLRYEINPHLVRGLDYYNQTVFEWVTNELGAQGTVCAGGRYDRLVEQLGGKPTPAIGFAIGLERLIELVGSSQTSTLMHPLDVYIITTHASEGAIIFTEALRKACPQLCIITDCTDSAMKTQFKRAEASHAKFALVLRTEDETIELKFLHAPKSAQSFNFQELVQFFNEEN